MGEVDEARPMRALLDLREQQIIELLHAPSGDDVVELDADIRRRQRPVGLDGDEAGFAASVAVIEDLAHILHIDIGHRLGVLRKDPIVLFQFLAVGQGMTDEIGSRSGR